MATRTPDLYRVKVAQASKLRVPVLKTKDLSVSGLAQNWRRTPGFGTVLEREL